MPICRNSLSSSRTPTRGTRRDEVLRKRVCRHCVFDALRGIQAPTGQRVAARSAASQHETMLRLFSCQNALVAGATEDMVGWPGTIVFCLSSRPAPGVFQCPTQGNNVRADVVAGRGSLSLANQCQSSVCPATSRPIASQIAVVQQRKLPRRPGCAPALQPTSALSRSVIATNAQARALSEPLQVFGMEQLAKSGRDRPSLAARLLGGGDVISLIASSRRALRPGILLPVLRATGRREGTGEAAAGEWRRHPCLA